MTTPARAICVIGVSSGATPLNPRYFFQKPPMLMALVSNTYAPSSSHLHGGVRKLRQCTPREKQRTESHSATQSATTHQSVRNASARMIRHSVKAETVEYVVLDSDGLAVIITGLEDVIFIGCADSPAPEVVCAELLHRMLVLHADDYRMHPIRSRRAELHECLHVGERHHLPAFRAVAVDSDDEHLHGVASSVLQFLQRLRRDTPLEAFLGAPWGIFRMLVESEHPFRRRYGRAVQARADNMCSTHLHSLLYICSVLTASDPTLKLVARQTGDLISVFVRGIVATPAFDGNEQE